MQIVSENRMKVTEVECSRMDSRNMLRVSVIHQAVWELRINICFSYYTTYSQIDGSTRVAAEYLVSVVTKACAHTRAFINSAVMIMLTHKIREIAY